MISEAFHHLKSIQIKGKWQWPDPIQMDGIGFKKIIDSYLPNEILKIKSTSDFIIISNGRSSLNISRLDGLGRSKIIEAPIPLNKKHRGKVEIKTETM